MQLLLDAETAQRGFLLTEDTRYLRQFDPAVKQLDLLLDQVRASYSAAALATDVARVDQLRKLSGMKLGEMLGSLRLYGEQDRTAAMALINTDIGEKTMAELRGLVTDIYQLEDDRLRAATLAWREDLRTSRILLGATSGFSLLLILIVGVLVARDMQRRDRDRLTLNERNQELDRIVRQRTALLFELSSSLQKVSEREKAALARELHDELGGLLVATKMDVSMLRRSYDDGRPDSAVRWDRVLRSLDEGLDLKRRVIESLRPTLLDNLGLVAAIRWLVDESARRAGLACDEEYAEPLPELSADANIAVFRVVQECLMNIMKHARAKHVRLRVATEERELSVTIQDDGVGIDEQRIAIPQSHGLLAMRHRIEALGGTFRIRALGPGAGTAVSFTLPWERVRRSGNDG
jgi:signal transduction histidine kinase